MKIFICDFCFIFFFAQAIAKAVQNYDLNFVMSPFSVWSLMVLLAEGATDQTLNQLKNVLHLPNDLTQLRTAYNEIQHRLQTNTTAIELTANHAIFSNINYNIDNKYISTLAHAYSVEHVPVNFQNTYVAAKTINDYISVRTQGKIQDVVQPNDLIDIQLLMASSIFFRGQWKVCWGCFFFFGFFLLDNMNFRFFFCFSTHSVPAKRLINHFIVKMVIIWLMFQ